MRGQLLEENRKGAVFRYNYDAAGNRIRKEETGENRNTEAVYAYNEKNQLIHTEELRSDGIRRSGQSAQTAGYRKTVTMRKVCAMR